MNLNTSTENNSRSIFTKNWFVPLIKISAIILFITLVYHQYSKVSGNDVLYTSLQVILAHPYFEIVLIILIFLTIGNYVVESVKWKQLLRPIEKVSIYQSLRGVFSGVLFSVYTPGRVGEIGGRIWILQPENRWQGAASILVGSIAQNIAILSLGFIATSYLLYIYSGISTVVLCSIIVGFVTILTCSVYLLYNIQVFIPLVRRIPMVSRWKSHLAKFKNIALYTNTDLTIVLALSILRIMIWTLQYTLVMYIIANIDFNIENICVILTIFLLQTGLPLPPVFSIIARSGVAVFAWGIVNINEWNALTATFVIYFINLVIPSMIGLFVLLKKRF